MGNTPVDHDRHLEGKRWGSGLRTSAGDAAWRADFKKRLSLAAVVEDLPPDPDVCRHGQLRSWAASGADEEQALPSFDG